jgi:hypothetical protein
LSDAPRLGSAAPALLFLRLLGRVSGRPFDANEFRPERAIENEFAFGWRSAPKTA